MSITFMQDNSEQVYPTSLVDAATDIGVELVAQRAHEQMKSSAKRGIKVARNVTAKLLSGEALTHPPIIEGVRTSCRTNIVAAPTRFNYGLMRGFGIRDIELSEIVGGSTIALGKTGLTAHLEPIEDRFDFTDEEVSALRGENPSFAVLPPLPALRAVLTVNPVSEV